MFKKSIPLQIVLSSLLFIFCILPLLYSCKRDTGIEPYPKPSPVKGDTITVSVEQVTHRSISLQISKKLNVRGDRYRLNRILNG